MSLKNLKRNLKADPEFSNSEYEHNKPKATENSNSTNKQNRTLKEDTETSDTDYESIVSKHTKSKYTMIKQKNALNSKQKTTTHSFQSLENKVQNFTKVKQLPNTTTLS